MKLITFQPLKVLEEVSKTGIYEPEYKENLGKRVFCLKLDENTMENIFITAPSMPQVLIELNVDDSRVETLDYLEWVNYLNGHRKYTGKYVNKIKYKEYAIENIKSSDIVKVINISNSDDPDKVQDMFMDAHFEYIEKLSGYQWKRNKDASMRRFWTSPEAYTFVNKITQCMMPLTPLTDKELEEAHKLIKEVYRID